MTKHFCDCCGSELNKENAPTGGDTRGRLYSAAKGKEPMIEVITGHNGTWNAGEFCKGCIIDAVNRLDDRPRPAI